MILGDTMGELRKFYCLADAVFVGRSLVDMGGSDPIEVSALGKLSWLGLTRRTSCCRCGCFRMVRGLWSCIREQAAEVVIGWLQNREKAKRTGQAGRAIVLANQGATNRQRSN